MRFPLLLTELVMLIGAVIVFRVLRAAAREHVSRSWPVAPGVVTSLRLVPRGRPRATGFDRDVRMEYDYWVGGYRYPGRRYDFGAGLPDGFDPTTTEGIRARYPPGARVWVRYDPLEPGDAVVVPRVRRAAAGANLLLGFTLLLGSPAIALLTMHEAEVEERQRAVAATAAAPTAAAFWATLAAAEAARRTAGCLLDSSTRSRVGGAADRAHDAATLLARERRAPDLAADLAQLSARYRPLTGCPTIAGGGAAADPRTGTGPSPPAATPVATPIAGAIICVPEAIDAVREAARRGHAVLPGLLESGHDRALAAEVAALSRALDQHAADAERACGTG